MTKPASGGVAGEHARTRLPLYVAPTSVGTHGNALGPAIAPTACWRLEDVRFEFDSSVIRPDARAELTVLATLHGRLGGPTASVFGHADPVGDDNYNKTLSGRRAAAIYGLLTRDLDLWDRLYAQPFSTDNGQHGGLAMMRQTTGQDAAAGRRDVFAAYMDAICQDAEGKAFVVGKDGFLGGGADPEGKADYQGCSERNPILLFSAAEVAALASVPAERNRQNGPNRRVIVFLFPPGFHVAPASWPCPRASEPVTGCKPHAWPDGDARRANTDTRREYERDRDTFACAFYDGMARRSPCEVVRKTLEVRLMGPSGQPIANAPYVVDAGDRREGVADRNGYLREPDLVAPDQITIEYADPTIHGDLRPYRARVTLGLATRRDDESFVTRLANLGYGRTTIAGDAIACFQREYHLDVSRQLDAATKDAILVAHDQGQPRPAPPSSGAPS